MRRWTWCLAAVVGLGLAAGCEKRGEESLMQGEQGRAGERPFMGAERTEQDAPLEGKGRLGGENVVDQEFLGTVTSVSPNQVVVRNDSGEQLPLRINEQTQLVRNGVRVGAQELREGTNVRASYDERDGAYIATDVTVFPSSAQPKPAPAPEK
jgi:hypothetical protein